MDKHRQLMVMSGIPEKSIIPQACPGLASAIENNPEGPQTKQIIGESVREALRKCKQPDLPLYAYLACTHYGYVKDIFAESIKKEGFANYEAFDPNQSMVENLCTILKLPSPETYSTESMVRLKIYSRCTILDREIDSITALLSNLSLNTAQVLKNYTQVPDLF
jgi:glutamate racemase